MNYRIVSEMSQFVGIVNKSRMARRRFVSLAAD